MDASLTQKKYFLALGFALCGLAVILGAFGAHALEQSLSDKALQTYQTGIDYHFFHALALIIGANLLAQGHEIQASLWAFIIGIVIFSGGCYLYALTGVKQFALIVPIGGVSFIFGWLLGAFKVLKSHKV